MKNFLPQSSSDFIYAIIVEEFGSAGEWLLPFLYLIISKLWLAQKPKVMENSW